MSTVFLVVGAISFVGYLIWLIFCIRNWDSKIPPIIGMLLSMVMVVCGLSMGENAWITNLDFIHSLENVLPQIGKDYSNYFSIQEIIPSENETENILEVHYSIENSGKNKNLKFCVTVDGKTIKHSVAPQETRDGVLFIDIGRPEEYNLSYNITYEVYKKQKCIWTKDEVITYDCTNLFIHQATIIYDNESVKVELEDYKTHSFNISDLFPSFDATKLHGIVVENKAHENVVLKEKPHFLGSTSAVGNILEIYAGEHHYNDNLVIKIEPGIYASSVKWEEHLCFLRDAKERYEALGFYLDTPLLETYVKVENPSDEVIFGSVVKFYVNDTPVADKFFSGNSDWEIEPKKTRLLTNYTSGPVMVSTGVKVPKRLGMEIVLKDKNGSILYQGIQWLNLKV